ncbi:MAG: ATP synthase F1 subunit delta [Actinobacteria bacterium]|nr:ATP synthase F1 subunit delta [Actinomycetota bacterium]
MPTNRTLIKMEIATYANVLLEAAKNAGTIFEVNAQLVSALSIIRENMDLRSALEDMTFDTATRSGIVKEIFKDYDPSLVAMLALMAERGDTAQLSRVCDAYNLAAEEDTKTMVVDVTTVVALTDELRETIKKKLSAENGKEIVLREHIDPAILGGIVMGAHGKRIDASVLSQLEAARVVLSTVPGGGER